MFCSFSPHDFAKVSRNADRLIFVSCNSCFLLFDMIVANVS